MARKRGGVADWIAQAELPILVLDGRRRVRVFNNGFSRLTGVQPGEVLGRRCDVDPDHPREGVAALLDSLACLETCFGGAPGSVEITVPVGAGVFEARTALLLPLSSPEGDAHLVVTLLETRPTDTPDAVGPADHAVVRARAVMLAERYAIDRFVVKTPAMERVARQLSLASASTASVLIAGSRGSGRSLVAHLIHQRSGAEPDDLAIIDGRMTNDATFSELLHSLQESRHPPATVICDHLDEWARGRLEEFCKAMSDWPVDRAKPRCIGIGRAGVSEPDRNLTGDLFGDVRIVLPDLRDRRKEIPLLAQQILEETVATSREAGREPTARAFDDATRRLLLNYGWPGNVAELKKVVIAAVEAAAGELVTEGDLPLAMTTGMEAELQPPRVPVESLDDVLEKTERRHIEAALKVTGGEKQKAAKLLGLTRAKLYRRIENLGIAVDEVNR